MKSKILITGITGQLGSFLAEKYLLMNYSVHGIIRRHSNINSTNRIDHIFNELNLYYGDLTDSLSIDSIIQKVMPDILINCAAQSHVATSYDIPLYTSQVDAIGTLIILESVKKHCPTCKVVQMSTSELFGEVLETPQTEKTPFNPVSPYSIAKLYAYYITKNYRDCYNIWSSNIICFNMESERRGSTFVTKKITEGLSEIYYKMKNSEKFNTLKLGNLNSFRDWGYCPDYADGIIKLLEQDNPDDIILATNETHSIKEFIEECCKYINIDIEWVGTDINEKGIDNNTGQIIVEIDKRYFRPAEVDILLGDYSKAKRILGWEPKVRFSELVKIMMKNDLKKYIN